jgi:hypothetical protein
MVEHACEACGKKFKAMCDYRRHQQRKTPCSPIVDPAPDTGRPSCQFCGRTFASRDTLVRHIRNNCKIARSDEGMELLFEHTYKRQEEEKALVATQEENERLRTELEQLRQSGAAQINATNIGQVNTGPVDLSQNQHNTVNIISFNEAPLRLSTEQLITALRVCPGFSQYAMMGDTERFHKDNRAVVHDSIMDLTKLSHEDPLSRNVYLSPNRADQAMILASKDVDTKKWEILPLSDALKQMIGGLSKELRKVGHDHSIRIDIDDRGALCGLGFITQVEETRLAHELMGPMSAHLENQRPDRPDRKTEAAAV